jgi:2-methylcitrate dehydratase PrpD
MPVHDHRDPITRFAEHVAATRYEDLSGHAVRAVKTFVLDSLGVGVAGSGETWAPRLLECARGWGDGDEATVWGTGARLPATSAALVNAYQIHCMEFDCLHEGAVVHPMASALAAALAHAERLPAVSGRQLATAIAVGVDVATSLGMAARGAFQFFRPATAGAFGATAAVGKLSGLDAATLTDAFGIAYSQVCGTMQAHVEGSKVLGMQIGFNARAALTAVDLAARGLVGPHGVLEGEYGYFRLFEGADYDLEPVLTTLGRTWQITRLAHKPFPSGRLTQGAVDGLGRLRAQHGFDVAEVATVTVRVPPLVRRLVSRPDIAQPDATYARLCLPFVAATALLRGTVDVPDFAPDRLVDPATHALASRIEVVADDNPDENALVPQTVEVRLANGQRHAVRLDAVIGHPDHPLSRAQYLDKFRRCWTYGAQPLPPARGERLIERIDQLEDVEDVRELVALTVAL